MKKYLIILVAALISFAGCKKENKYTSLRFKNAEVALGEGYSDKLQVLYEPTSLEYPKCEWSSSNPAVVKVDQTGTIEGLSIGEANITAKLGDLTAVCKVTVVNPFDLISWSGWGLFNLEKDSILSKDTVKVTISTGEEVSCVQIPAVYYIWDDGIYEDESGSLSGAGYMIEAEGTALLITDDLGKGPNYYYLGTSYLSFVDPDKYDRTDTAYAYCCPAGKITGTAAQHLEWLEDTTETAQPAFVGSRIAYVDIDNGKYLDYMAGLAGAGIFGDGETGMLYRAYESFFTGDCKYGLLWVETEEGWTPKEPAEWAPLKEVYFEYLGGDAAPKYTAKEFVAPKQDIRKFTRPTNVLSVK